MADEAKPPYVQFEVRSIEDREATIKAGHFVGQDVIFALVTPAGTRDRIEREAKAWLDNVQEGVKQDRIPGFWYDAYKRALDDFRNSRETPEFGTAIQTWPGATPSQVKLLLDINVRTVEELGAANEETMGRIGMGARALKEKANTWLQSATDTGKVVEEISQLRIANEELQTRNNDLEARLLKLEAAQKSEEEVD